MAQQSVRRGRDNQGFPQCFEHAWVIWTQPANSHTGRRLLFAASKAGQMTASDPRASNDPDVFPCLKGGVHRWVAPGRPVVVMPAAAIRRTPGVQGGQREPPGRVMGWTPPDGIYVPR